MRIKIDNSGWNEYIDMWQWAAHGAWIAHDQAIGTWQQWCILVGFGWSVSIFHKAQEGV